MVTLIIAIMVGLGIFAEANWGVEIGPGWSVFLGIVGFGAFQAVSGMIIQKKVKRDMEAVQGILVAGQKRIQAKMQRWQMRPPSSIKSAQIEIAADTKVFVKEALERTKVLDKYRLWVPMMDRQIATARVQLNWMVKDFAAVDALMPKVLLLDPSTVALKMARMYMTCADMIEIEKVYRKGVSRVKYNGNVLLAATMSWMQLKKGDVDGAFKTLTEALKKSDNEVLKRNHEVLMNNRPAHFTNSGIGDQWYALYLEEPKVHTQRQHQVYR